MRNIPESQALEQYFMFIFPSCARMPSVRMRACKTWARLKAPPLPTHIISLRPLPPSPLVTLFISRGFNCKLYSSAHSVIANFTHPSPDFNYNLALVKINYYNHLITLRFSNIAGVAGGGRGQNKRISRRTRTILNFVTAAVKGVDRW